MAPKLRKKVHSRKRAPAIHEASDGSAIDSLISKGVGALATGRTIDASRIFEHVLELDQANATARNGLAVVAMRAGRHADAADLLREAIALDPKNPELHSNRGVALSALGHLESAVECYRAALELNPALPVARGNLGGCLSTLGQPEAGLVHFREALKYLPDCRSIGPDFARTLLKVGAWDEAERVLVQVQAELERELATGEFPRMQPFYALMLPLPIEMQIAVAERWATQFERWAVGAAPFSHSAERPERLRIGYFSPDFCSHAVGFLLDGLLEHHDATRFETFAYSLRDFPDDPIRERLGRAVDCFVDASYTPAIDIAQRIHADGINVLVDLSGYTTASRLDVLAYRPAPVQCHLLGYPATLGARFVDYFLSDATTHPESMRPYFTETLVHIESAAFAVRRYEMPDEAPTRTELGLPEDAFVFCYLGEPYRIDRLTVDTWASILRGVNGSVLWLRAPNATARANLFAAVEAAGVDPKRLYFADAEWLSERFFHRAADLWIDPLRLTSGTGAIIAAWAGLPVLSVAGPSPLTRTAAGVMVAAGLPEAVTESVEAFGLLAIELAHDKERLASWRKKLLDSRETCPLFDQARFMRDLEDHYVDFWERWREGRV